MAKKKEQYSIFNLFGGRGAGEKTFMNSLETIKKLGKEANIQTKKIVSDTRRIAGKKAWQTKKARQYFKAHPDALKDVKRLYGNVRVD